MTCPLLPHALCTCSSFYLEYSFTRFLHVCPLLTFHLKHHFLRKVLTTPPWWYLSYYPSFVFLHSTYPVLTCTVYLSVFSHHLSFSSHDNLSCMGIGDSSVYLLLAPAQWLTHCVYYINKCWINDVKSSKLTLIVISYHPSLAGNSKQWEDVEPFLKSRDKFNPMVQEKKSSSKASSQIDME